jgi:flagellar biosynthetic protein FliR
VEYLGIELADFMAFILVFFRVLAILLISPIFGSKSVPRSIKVGLSGLLALILFPVVPHPANLPLDALPLAVWIIREVLLGVLVGFATTVFFMGLQMGGSVIGVQVGFGMINIIDPMTGTSVTILGQFIYFIAVLLFFTLDGHHFLIRALTESFSVIPLGESVLTGLTLKKMVELTAQVFVVAIKIVAPTMGVLICVTFGMGVLARTVPQMNIFIVGFPLNICIGLLTLMLTFPLFVYVFGKLMEGMKEDVLYLMYSM